MGKIKGIIFILNLFILSSCSSGFIVNNCEVNENNQYILPYEIMDCQSYDGILYPEGNYVFYIDDVDEIDELVDTKFLVNYDKKILEKKYFKKNKLIYVLFRNDSYAEGLGKNLNGIYVDENKIILEYIQTDFLTGLKFQCDLIQIPYMDYSNYEFVISII